MTTSSAPGKVYLFGEHAVVYGEPAVPCAIEQRVHATVETSEVDALRVHADDMTLDGFTVSYGDSGATDPAIDVAPAVVDAAMGYVRGAIATAREAAGVPDAGFEVTIESALPLGAGLGSSAAVVVAVIDAATREVGVELPRTDLADLAFQVEYDVQDGRASRADTFCSTMGGAVRIEGDECRGIGDVPSLPFVVGYDGGAGNTGELVARVRALRDQYGFAADTVGAIGEIVREGEQALAADDLSKLGELMDFDHGLLGALGVSSRSLDAMVWAARDAGALGAKLTGAGGGGCIVALDETDGTHMALELTPECEQAFRAELDTDGVRVEA